MLHKLESYVLKLHDCLVGSQFSDLSRSLVSDIVYICGENVTPQAIGMSFFLFQLIIPKLFKRFFTKFKRYVYRFFSIKKKTF